jgi:hypothetical protein
MEQELLPEVLGLTLADFETKTPLPRYIDENSKMVYFAGNPGQKFYMKMKVKLNGHLGYAVSLMIDGVHIPYRCTTTSEKLKKISNVYSGNKKYDLIFSNTSTNEGHENNKVGVILLNFTLLLREGVSNETKSFPEITITNQVKRDDNEKKFFMNPGLSTQFSDNGEIDQQTELLKFPKYGESFAAFRLNYDTQENLELRGFVSQENAREPTEKRIKTE